jgi:hypothetical protein
MTPHQAICHLNDSYLTVFGEKRVSSITPPLPRAVMKFAALYIPMRWPKNLPTMPEVDQVVAGTAPLGWDQDRAALCATIQRFARAGDAISGAAHPMFGSMRAADWMRWGYLHADHHLRQFGI